MYNVKGWRDVGCITCKGWKTRDANVNFFLPLTKRFQT